MEKRQTKEKTVKRTGRGKNGQKDEQTEQTDERTEIRRNRQKEEQTMCNLKVLNSNIRQLSCTEEMKQMSEMQEKPSHRL
jgi:hypothetical protein